MLMEALVYIGLVVVVLGVAFALMYRLVDNSVVLRRNADDVAAAMRAGERWRADIRAATEVTGPETRDNGQVLRVSGSDRLVLYRFENDTLWLKVGEQPWVRLLENVKSSVMQTDPRQRIMAWRWELEMGPRAKGYTKPGRVRPLFTFTAVVAGSLSR